MHDADSANMDACSLRVGVAVSRYHREITDGLLAGARDTFQHAGGTGDRLVIMDAPGTWELTAVCRSMALLETRMGRPMLDAIVALGCVLAGETTHDRYIAQGVTQGLTAIMTQTGTPIALGVLTCQTIEQARARSAWPASRDGGNKGVEAMRAAIVSAKVLRALQHMDRSLR